MTAARARPSWKTLCRAGILGRFLRFSLEDNSSESNIRICLAAHRLPIIHTPVMGTPVCVHAHVCAHAHTRAVNLQWKETGVNMDSTCSRWGFETFFKQEKSIWR